MDEKDNFLSKEKDMHIHRHININQNIVNIKKFNKLVKKLN